MISSMTTAASTSDLRIVKSSKLAVSLFTRGLSSAADMQQGLTALANQLIKVAEHAYACRDLQILKESSELLLSLPIEQAQSAGLWFKAITYKREGRTEQAVSGLEHLIADCRATPRFKARAIQTLGAIRHESGELTEASRLYIESAQCAKDDIFLHWLSLIHLSAAQHYLLGPAQALRTLLNLEPLVTVIARAQPHYKGVYFNNLAIELFQLGRVKEAAQCSRVAITSPFARAYPEWKETALEIQQQRAKRNTVSIAVLPEPDSQERPAQPKYLLIVLQFSLPVRVIRPVAFRQRITCNNPTVALVMLVARIRAPSF